MKVHNQTLLIEGARAFEISLDERATEAFDLYLRELLKWNQKINLTAIRSEKGIVLKHFLDSLSVAPYLPESSSILDIGSGAGFPGIPLKIAKADFSVTLIDSVRKKVDFQRHIIRTLDLKKIEAVHGRVQDNAILHKLGGRFDVALSRAVTDLPTFLALSYPFLRKGGTAAAMKGAREAEWISEAKELPYHLKRTVPFTLPFTHFQRTILLFEKQQLQFRI